MCDNINYNYISTKLNKIFCNLEIEISQYIYEMSNIKTRKTKVSYLNAFIYSILYVQNHKTKQDSVNILNKYHNLSGDNLLKRTTLYEKEIKIPLSFYVKIFNNLLSLYDELFCDKNLIKKIAVDGTYNNTNVYNIKGYLETSLNLGFFDINNEIPLDLTFNGIKNKNNELQVLLDYIGNNSGKFQNVILIMDRGYCSYNFLKFLSKKKIYYICRFRNNCSDFDKINKNVRVIEFTNTYYETIKNEHTETHLINNKKFKDIVVEFKDEYKLVTNLPINTYNDQKIKVLYHERWDIEVFFKILKKNFNFENLRYTNNDEKHNNYYTHNVKILICCILSKILERTYKKVNNIKSEGTKTKRKFKKIKKEKVKPYNPKKKIKKKNKNEKIINIDITNNKDIVIKNNITTTNEQKDNPKTKTEQEEINNVDISNNKQVIIKNNNITTANEQKDNSSNKTIKCIIKTNKSLLIKAVFNLLNPICNAKLNEFTLKNELDMNVQLSKVDPTINNKRICKTPFKKWYIKGYINKTDLVKMLEYKLTFRDKINNNLKSKSKMMNIIQINYI